METPSISSPFGNISLKRRKNTWYTINSGNWSDGNIWVSNGHRRYSFPQKGDDVYIYHDVNIDANFDVNNLRSNANIACIGSARTMTVRQDFRVNSLSMSGAAHILYLYGSNNRINSLISGGSSSISYRGIYDQNILDLPYYNLDINGSSTKYLTSNTIISGNYTSGTTNIGAYSYTKLECSGYNLSIIGTSNWAVPISKSGAGSLIFGGLVTTGNNVKYSAIEPYNFYFGGNPTVEFKGGLTSNNISTNGVWNGTGTGTWIFSTNNQSWIGSSPSGATGIVFTCPVIISGNINLILSSVGGNTNFTFNNIINGDSAGSTLTNRTNLSFGTLASTSIMTTGIFDFTTYTSSTVSYFFNEDYTLPYTTYQNLIISGANTKILNNNTTVRNLYVSAGSTFELSNYNLSVTGTTTVNGTLSKSGTGNVLFTGQVYIQGAGISYINFSGNPSVELRGGINIGNNLNSNTGTGIWSFTTNNQSIVGTSQIGVNAVYTFDCPILISGAIVLTADNTGTNSYFTFNNSINGDNSNSGFENKVSVQYKAMQVPMLIGNLITNSSANTFTYSRNGNQDIKGGVNTSNKQVYNNLILSVGGVKTLQGYVSATGTYTLSSPATLNNNGFTLTNP